MTFPALKLQRKGREAGKVKTRVFSVRLLGHLAANRLWEPGGSAKAVRPVWIAYLGTDQESRAFTANFRAGRLAEADGDRFQAPKRSPHRWVTQRVPGGVVTVAYLPQLFHLEPPAPCCQDVRFVFSPPRWWLERQAERLEPEYGAEAWEAARAALFAAFLDRRTALPVIRDLAFHLRLYRAAREAEWVHEPESSRYAHGLLTGGRWAACGLDEPLACRVDAATFAEFLTHQTHLYHREEMRHGTTRRAADRRILPYSEAAPAQLCFDFAVA